MDCKIVPEKLKNNSPEVDETDDDVPQLSADTLAVLQEFYAEQESLKQLLESATLKDNDEDDKLIEKAEDNGDTDNKKKDKLFEIEMGKSFPEDWQLSQFWYDDETSMTMAKEVLSQAGTNGKVACVSCPSIFRACNNASNVTLFEYDRRFKAFGSSFHFYDYNEPEKIPESCIAAFSVVIADPPFLSEECLEKVAITVKKLVEKHGKIILCTGSVMESVAERVLQLKRTSFVPHHKHNLGNEFACFANYELNINSVDS